MMHGVVLTALCLLASCVGTPTQDSYNPRINTVKTNNEINSMYACIEQSRGDRFKQLGCR